MYRSPIVMLGNKLYFIYPVSLLNKEVIAFCKLYFPPALYSRSYVNKDFLVVSFELSRTKNKRKQRNNKLSTAMLKANLDSKQFLVNDLASLMPPNKHAV